VSDNSQRKPIFLITGTPGAGKTSAATMLMRRFPFGLHIPVDDLREWVVSGLADPVPTWTDETTRQFHLARQAASYTARLYADAGFAVAIDDVVFPDEAEALFVAPLSGYTLRKVLLRPGVEMALSRNAQRTNKSYNTAGLVETIRNVHEMMPPETFARMGWIVIDSTYLSLEETVDEILKHI
jgi:chloramphenicol 3-O-phosphotransferase